MRVYGPYFDGLETVYGDPFRINNRLSHALDGNINDWLMKYRAGVPEDGVGREWTEEEIANYNSCESFRYEATNKLIDATVVAFELTRFNKKTGQGLGEEEIMDILRAWLEWGKKKEEPGATSPTTSAPSTVGLQASVNQPAVAVTPPFMQSGPTSNGCGCNEPLVRPAVYPSPGIMTPLAQSGLMRSP